MDGTDVPPLAPLPVSELGGKTRVATLHPAEEVHSARRLTQLWLRALRGLVTTRDSLKGNPVTIERQDEDALIFSADLSAATDHIDHGLAQLVAEELCIKLGRPHDIDLAKKLFGPKLVDGAPTTCGVHMGLGPSWVVLCLLNGFAAWQAGARKETYRICGDDLVGYWSKQTSQRYIRVLEQLGLKVNRPKSFFGPRGVFCEQLVTRHGAVAHAKDVGHLAGIALTKARARITSYSLAAAIQSQNTTILPSLAAKARQSLVPRTAGPGRIEYGGVGTGAPSKARLCQLAKHGVMDGTQGVRLPEKCLIDVELLNNRPSGGLPLSEVIVHIKTAQHLTARLNNAPHATRPLTRKEFLSRGKWKGAKPSPTLLRQLVLANDMPSRNKRDFLYLLQRDPQMKPDTRKRLASILAKPRAERYVASETAVRLINSYAPSGWVFSCQPTRPTAPLMPTSAEVAWVGPESTF